MDDDEMKARYFGKAVESDEIRKLMGFEDTSRRLTREQMLEELREARQQAMHHQQAQMVARQHLRGATAMSVTFDEVDELGRVRTAMTAEVLKMQFATPEGVERYLNG